jgi:hypothetical protein
MHLLALSEALTAALSFYHQAWQGADVAGLLINHFVGGRFVGLERMFAGAACDSVATITLDPLAGVTPPLFAYSGGNRTFPWANAESISPKQEHEQKYPSE